jgi:hypothetical protein
MFSDFIYVVTKMEFPGFLRLNRIPIVYIYHTVLIHLCVDEHLGWLHILAVVNTVWSQFEYEMSP